MTRPGGRPRYANSCARAHSGPSSQLQAASTHHAHTQPLPSHAQGTVESRRGRRGMCGSFLSGSALEADASAALHYARPTPRWAMTKARRARLALKRRRSLSGGKKKKGAIAEPPLLGTSRHRTPRDKQAFDSPPARVASRSSPISAKHCSSSPRQRHGGPWHLSTIPIEILDSCPARRFASPRDESIVSPMR